MRALQELKDLGMADCLNLLHFHLGSQITNIRQIKGAVNEAVRVYVDLARAGAGLKYLDVGGGLGIDYDGSQTDFESSVNYTLQEYANDIIYHVQNVCDEVGGAPHHHHESGRAIAAYHSVLVFNVLGVAGMGEADVPPEPPPTPSSRSSTCRKPTAASPPRTCWKATTTRSRRSTRRSTCSAWATCRSSSAASPRTSTGRSRARSRSWRGELDYFPEELEGIDAMLSDTYFCNFSLFQSMPDSWAIKQLFPIMPIHRLEEQPTRPAVLGDITCDSDGKVDAFIDRRDVKRTCSCTPSRRRLLPGRVPAGRLPGNPGRPAQPVRRHQRRARAPGPHRRSDAGFGDQGRHRPRSAELRAVLLRHAGGKLRRDVEAALREGRLTYEESGALLRFYEEGLHGYTYLEDVHE
jgi:arginine decarboxylase